MTVTVLFVFAMLLILISFSSLIGGFLEEDEDISRFLLVVSFIAVALSLLCLQSGALKVVVQ